MSARLIAEIGADVSGFERGLNRADTAASKFMRDVSGKMSRAFGAGFLAGAVTMIPRKFVEQAEEIIEGAAKLKTTTDEYQMLTAAAKDAGMEISEFIKKNAEQGIMLDALISKMREYRSQIKFSSGELSEWQEISEGVKAFGSGVAAPFGWLARKLYGLGAVGLNLGGALGGTIGGAFGIPGLGQPEDYLNEASKHAHRVFGLKVGPQDAGSKPLPLPTGHGQTARFKQLQESLKVLEGREAALRSEGSLKTSLWNPALTERQQAGAYVMRGGIAVTEQEKTNSILSDVRKEITETKEQIRKLVDQGG
jgi:hypothetical protein